MAAASEALSALLEVAEHVGIKAVEGAVPTALATTTTATGAGSVESCGAGRRKRGTFFTTTVACVGCAGAFPVQPDGRPRTGGAVLSPPPSTAVTGADGARAATRPLPP